MSATSEKVALVTGADRGIGAAVATRLHRDGYTVYGTLRHADAPRFRAPGFAFRALVASDTRQGGSPEAVADVVLAAASAAVPTLRYPVGAAKLLSRLWRFVPAGMFEKSFRHRFALEA